MFTERLQVLFQYIIPHHLLSRLVGLFTHSRHRTFKDRLIRYFIHHYSVDMNSAANPDPSSYPDFNTFFTRPLKPGLRPVVAERAAIAGPVDGIISQMGSIENGRIIQAKKFNFSLEELVGGSPERAALFDAGKFITLYLSPKDYHRIHMPLTGKLREMIYIPGRIFSVNPLTAEHVPRLFARNERVVCIFDTVIGSMAIILVGAMICASISTVWHGVVTPPNGKQVRVWKYPLEGEGAVFLQRGEEMGCFQLGSTVIVLFGHDVMQWASSIQPGHEVRYGELLGHYA